MTLWNDVDASIFFFFLNWVQIKKYFLGLHYPLFSQKIRIYEDYSLLDFHIRVLFFFFKKLQFSTYFMCPTRTKKKIQIYYILDREPLQDCLPEMRGSHNIGTRKSDDYLCIFVIGANWFITRVLQNYHRIVNWRPDLTIKGEKWFM